MKKRIRNCIFAIFYLAVIGISLGFASSTKDPAFLPYRFISRPLGAIYLSILLPGLAGFLVFALAKPEQRRAIRQSPAGILNVLDQFFEVIHQSISLPRAAKRQLLIQGTIFWRQLFSITTLCAFGYVFMEWLFFATKPSFMDIMSSWGKAELLLLTGLMVAESCLALVAIAFALDLLLVALLRLRAARFVGVLIPTAILAALALLLVDNFTYTMFKVGISTSAGGLRSGYRLFFVLLFIAIFIQVLKRVNPMEVNARTGKGSKYSFYFAGILLVLGTTLALIRVDDKAFSPARTRDKNQLGGQMPNILLLGSDGMSAENLSAYGYERNTTPRLRQLSRDSLLAENAFPNSGTSAGSVVSIMTSKLPTTTRVGLSIDILTGIDAYQHLPGILRNEGYKTVEFGVPSYVDAYLANIQNGFDVANNRTQKDNPLSAEARNLGFNNPAYFIDILSQRISERLQHIFFIRDMKNPYTLVMEPGDSLSDQEKIDQALALFEQAQRPLFVHIHLMGTHGAKYSPSRHVFSKGEQQDKPWMVDFYDDSILSFDAHVGQVIDKLKETGQYDHTILVIYSDHDRTWTVNNRIPLMIHFPANAYAGRISANVQNLDIAPTVLDYLGLSIPDWMDGDSLLKSPDVHRRIFGAGIISATKHVSSVGIFTAEELKHPPFFQFGTIDVIDCQEWYRLNLKTGELSTGIVAGYQDPCSTESLASPEEIRLEIIQKLSEDGYDVSSLAQTTLSQP